MYTLGIETSCDETACAVLKGPGQVLSNVVSSSLAKHRLFGGVVPEIASRHSLEAIDVVYREALRRAQVKPSQLDLISVTRGPGLIGSLFVGVSFAKALGFSLGIPLVGINHIEAHLEVNFLAKRRPKKFIGVVVSGGHTTLLLYQDGRYRIIGQTVDDAIGEAYDKVAKILNLGYPGGPVIDRLAQGGNSKTFSFTKPKQEGEFDFSFSGIKTAVLHLYQREQKRFKSEKYLRDFCASFQETVMRWIVDKSCRACEQKHVKTIVVGGGVSANSRLRSLLADETKSRKIDLRIPPVSFTTDNAVMIARLGWCSYQRGERSDFRMAADPSLRIGQ